MGEQVLATLDNLSFIYIVCGVLLLFYLFICVYIWCNERRKREKLTTNFQKGSDREQRVAYLREKNLERKKRLQEQRAMQEIQAPMGLAAEDQYQNMQHHVQQ